MLSAAYPHKQQLSCASRPSSSEAVAQAIRVLAATRAPPVSPQEMALLVSGVLLVVCWHYLAYQVSSFDVRGLSSLVEMWFVAVVALAIGQVARTFTPALEASREELDDLACSLAAAASSSCRTSGMHPAKEGREEFVITSRHHDTQAAVGGSAGAAAAEEEDEEDVAVIKRRAQAEAAAKLQRYQLGVQQQLAAITAAAQAGSGVAPDLLFVLAEQLFASPINLSEFVLLGGLPVVLAAMQSLAAQLSRQQQPKLQTLKALMQACWVVLQLAHGPPACKAALEEPHVVAVLLSTSQAVAQLPSTHAPATESILRNLWWTLLLLCDPRAAPRRAAFAAGEQQHPVLQQVLAQDDAAGVVSHLQQLVALQHGPSAGWLAAAQMGLVLQLGHESQQRQQQGQQQQEPASVARAVSAVVRAMLQPDSLAGLGFLLQGREQHARQYGSAVLVEGLLHYLLTFHAPELLRLLVEGQLVGAFAAGCSLKLGRLLVCQLLSSQGQAVLAAVEEEYELDVPLALAQVIPLKLHIKLPAAPRQQQQQHEAAGGGEIQPAAAAAATDQQEDEEQQASVQAAMADDTFTDAMACRLLLQHDRLQELLGAFCEEVRATQQQQQPGAPAGRASAAHQQDEEQQQPSLVLASWLALVQHLMTRDLQLHTVQHKLGDSVAASVSSASSRNSSIDAALAMPDSTGVYSSVLAGMVPADQLPAAAYRDGGSSSGGSTDALLTLPPPPPGMVMAAQQQQQQQVVMFQFGSLQHAVDAATYRQIKGSSSLVRSILRQAGDSSSSSPAVQQQQRVVRVLSIPHFTDAANCWVVRCLERWLQTRALEGFTPWQAAKLWVAADFLQVNELQVCCEDVMLTACESTPAFMDVVVELCARHSAPSARLLRLTVQQLLRHAGAAAATGPGDRGGCEAQAAAAPQSGVQLLRRLLAQQPGLLLPVMHAELRDRLLTLCIQNANLDADCPDEAVE